jgi:hypothetical protein
LVVHEGAEKVLAPADYHLHLSSWQPDYLYFRFDRRTFYLYIVLVGSHLRFALTDNNPINKGVNWKYKSLAQAAFSALPLGEHLNYLCQRFVTKSLPVSDKKFVQIASMARRHVEVFKKHWTRPLQDATFYEFGTGWDLIIPIGLFAAGIEHQVIVDIRSLVRTKLVRDTISKYEQKALDIGLMRQPPVVTLDGSGKRLYAVLQENFGIRYLAPCDARDTGLDTISVDCITSTDTLEHIPLDDMRAILKECHRLIRDDGIMCFRIDYQDHYSYFDKSISMYNFLRYSETQWNSFNSPLHYQNRMRHNDFLAVFKETNFEVIEEKRQEGTEQDLATIRDLPVDEMFAKYSLAELAVRGAYIVLRKSLA